jgi:cell division protein ZapA (FtsZ GTPase activity inhibitor)
MMDEKVEVQIGSRHLVVEMPDLFPTEISLLAQKVSERMTQLQAENSSVADSSKIALLVALSFAADLERERQANGTSQRSSIAGRITELDSSADGGEHFRAVLSQEDAAPVRLLIPTNLMPLVCRAFIAGRRVNLTGRTVPSGEQTCFSVSEIARSA